MKLSDLIQEYNDGESADKEIFAEQRSNILLIAGEHYSKKSSQYWDRIRDSRDLTQEQKLRLTKNHIYKIMRSYSNSIVCYAPFVSCEPNDDKSMQSVKSAQLHQKLLRYAHEKYRCKEKVRDWADDFVGIGEVGVKIFFDPSKGQQIGVEAERDEDGNDVQDPLTGELSASDNPVFSGDFVFETFYGFNCIRPLNCKLMADADRLTLRKMVSAAEMRKKYANDPEKLACFKDTPDGTYLVFDSTLSAYGRSTKDQCMVRETFIRPCMEYPKGYFYFWTEHGIYEQDELPFGIWPIAYAPFDKFQGSPRGRSHIKVLRPFQAEINRAASKIAEHQITHGDDKIITMAGTKIQQGGWLPGIRGVSVSGPAPVVMQGRAGEQFYAYAESQVKEMYMASLVEEMSQALPSQLDPYSLLFQAASKKQRFSVYTERFEQFMVDAFTIFLDLSRHYMEDDELIEAVGHDEAANIPEFRNPKKLGYQIRLEPQSDDIETKLGKTLMINQALQYTASKLDKQDIGRLMQNHPYANFDEDFRDFTLDYDSGTNMILALDRGQQPMPHDADDPKYMIKRLTNRTRKPDFELMSPQIHQNYGSLIAAYTNIAGIQAQKLMAAESDFIPTGGALVPCDVYVNDPGNPKADQKRARVPYEALNWLLQRLADQGTTLAHIEDMGAQSVINIAQSAGPKPASQTQPPPGMTPPGGMQH